MPTVRKGNAGSPPISDRPVREASVKKPSATRVPVRPKQSAVEPVPERNAVPAAAPATATVQVAGKPSGSRKRKRLAKAFPRPLDKVLRKNSSNGGARKNKPAVVRDGFTFLRAEHEVLVGIKEKLAEQGVKAKKGELVRVSLGLLALLSLEEITSLLERLPRAS